MKDDGYFKSINTSVLWYKNSPFILASQAETCFYLEDTMFGHPWKVVQTFGHRHVYDVPEKEDGDEDLYVGNDAYQEEEGSLDPIYHDFVDEDDEVEVEEEEVDRSDEVVHVDARIVHEQENQDDSGNADMDMSEDEQVDMMEERQSDDAEIDYDIDSDLE